MEGAQPGGEVEVLLGAEELETLMGFGRDAVNSRSRVVLDYSSAGRKAPSPLRSPGLPPSLITP